jgi:hypothetical protein
MGLGQGKGVCCFDAANKKFSYFAGNAAYPLRYPMCIAEDGKGDLWFTNDASTLLVKWNRQSARFQTIELPLTKQQEAGNLYGILCDGIRLFG